ncbi:Thiamine pyrophosphokinase, partial [Mycoplasma putrefaciens]
MKYKKALIVTAETNINLEIFNDNDNFIIGVERGCLDLIKKKIKIDLAIGDFDKVDLSELELIKQTAKKYEIW